jgi:hypothetical protein
MPDPDDRQLPPREPTIADCPGNEHFAPQSCPGCRQNTERINRLEAKIAELEQAIH